MGKDKNHQLPQLLRIIPLKKYHGDIAERKILLGESFITMLGYPHIIILTSPLTHFTHPQQTHPFHPPSTHKNADW